MPSQIFPWISQSCLKLSIPNIELTSSPPHTPSLSASPITLISNKTGSHLLNPFPFVPTSDGTEIPICQSLWIYHSWIHVLFHPLSLSYSGSGLLPSFKLQCPALFLCLQPGLLIYFPYSVRVLCPCHCNLQRLQWSYIVLRIKS